MKTRILAILIMIFSPTLQAQTVVQENADNYIVSVPYGTGLGQIVRTLGKEPNWAKLQWITSIQQVNEKQIQENGHILYPNIEIVVPKNAIAHLKDYGQVADQPQPQFEQQAVAVEPAPATFATNTTMKMPKAWKSKPKPFKVAFLTGYEQLDASSVNNSSDADLQSKMAFGLRTEYVSKKDLGPRAHAQWMNISYETPEGTTLDQADENIFEVGVGIQKRLSQRWHLFIDGIYKTQNYVQLNALNQITVEDLAAPAARLGVTADVVKSRRWNTQVTGSYTSLSAKDSGQLRIKEGYEAILGISAKRKGGFGFDLSYTNRNQDSSAAKHNSNLGQLGVTYSF